MVLHGRSIRGRAIVNHEEVLQAIVEELPEDWCAMNGP